MAVKNYPNYLEKGRLLAGKIILVTGAGDGIGKAVAIACAKQGADVILLGRTIDKLNQTYDIVSATTDTKPYILEQDLSKLDESSAISLMGGVSQSFGRLDGLVHNAAILGNISPYAQFDGELWQKVFQVNVHAAFLLSKHAWTLLNQSKNPSVIFTGSGVGQKGLAYWGAYSASKFANEGMMQTLAAEGEQNGVRVNLVDPGVVATKMRASAFPAENSKILPSADQMTDVYLYLLSGDSLGVTGQRLCACVK